MASDQDAATERQVSARILTLRGGNVILDADLAGLYRVPTKVMNQAVKRNLDRFPPDFLFQLTAGEVAELNRSQIVTGSQKHRDPRFPPYAFTEHGALMAANLLNSPQAVQMGVYVIRAFVRLRAELARNQDLVRRLAEIEKTLLGHDAALRDLYYKIRALLLPPPEPKRREIGFHARPDSPSGPKGAKK